MDNNTYVINFGRMNETIIAETPSKAKYRFFKINNIADEYDIDLTEFSKNATCKLIIKDTIENLYTDKEEFERMKNYRNIEFAYQGMTIEINGQKGVITGNIGMNLAVCLEGNNYNHNIHPHWKTKYFEKGKLIKEFSD